MKKFLASLLLLALGLSACNGGKPKDTGDTSDTLPIVSPDINYVVVRPDKAGEHALSAASRLVGAIKEKTGTDISITSDWIYEGIQEEQEYEILVGATNRSESETAINSIGENDFTVAVYNKKIVITGGNELSTFAAVHYFIENYLVKDGDTSLNIDKNLNYTQQDIDRDLYLRLYSGTPFPITPTRSAKETSLAINNTHSGDIIKLNSEEVVISKFDPNWAFTHFPQVTSFKGKLYAAWSNGPMDEYPARYRICLSTSEDFYNWTEPVALFTPESGTATSYYSGYFYATETRLNFSYILYEYTPTNEIKKKTYFYIYTEDGETWSEPITHRHGAYITAPRQTMSGRLLWPCGIYARYTSDLSGFGDWTYTYVDQKHIDAAFAAGALELVESTFYETPDYVIHMMMRGCDGYVWHTESYDNGNSWSAIYQTGFTDDNNMSKFGNLPDGRPFCINTPVNNGSILRAPLVLSIANDGYNFSEQYILRDEADYVMQQNGHAKEGHYGYTEVIFSGDYLYVIHSKMKEVIGITRVKLSDLSDNQAKKKVEIKQDSGIFYRFDSAAKIADVGILGDTKASYDPTEKAMKVIATGKRTPATIILGGISKSSAKYIFDETVSTKDYPILMLRVKKKNYTSKYMGERYVFATDRKTDPLRLQLMNYTNDEKWQTIVIDMSFVKSYVNPSNLPKFKGNWFSLQLGLAASSHIKENSEFFLQWLAVFPNITDAMNYAYSIQE